MVFIPTTALLVMGVSLIASFFWVWNPRRDGPFFLAGAVFGSILALFTFGREWLSIWGSFAVVPIAVIIAVIVGFFLSAR